MINKITSGVIVLFLLVGSFWLLGQDKQAKKSDFRLVTDSAGRQVSIPVRPQRVVALNASSIDLYINSGGNLVGRAKTEALPASVRAAVQGVPEVGLPPNPSLEQIVALQPDLVLGVNIPFHHALVPVLEKAGIPILLQNLDNVQQVLDTLQFYGELTGHPDKAAGEISRIENQYQAVVAGVKGKTAPRVLILSGTAESFSMALSGSFVGDLVNRLGGANISDQAENADPQSGYVPLSLEFVAKANPEIILFITHSSDENAEAKFRNNLKNHPVWRDMKAVQQNRVFKLPYHLFAVNPGTRVGEAVEVLTGLLYPANEIK